MNKVNIIRKKHCIICRELKEKFSVEHIIPDALGGHYTTDLVCEGCNSKLGGKVDYYLTEHLFSQMKREELKLKSQNGRVPHPLDRKYKLKAYPERTAKIYQDFSKIKLTPKVTKNGAAFDINDTHNIRSYCKKHNLELSDFITEKVDNTFVGNFRIDLFKYNLALLKIAYEFTCKEIPNYFMDDEANKISSILKKACYEEFDFKELKKSTFKFSSNLIEDDIFPSFKKYLNVETNRHYLILYATKECGLLCYINIFNCFFGCFRMSYKTYNIRGLVLENMIKENKANIFSLDDLIVQSIFNQLK